jgi:crotonobetainyl-CoA:carnitine CoA-transferase CaiB-like acyl-CoA transferase
VRRPTDRPLPAEPEAQCEHDAGAAHGILASLYDRERTGNGRHVEMALFDCGLMITAYYGMEALLAGEDRPSTATPIRPSPRTACSRRPTAHW